MDTGANIIVSGLVQGVGFRYFVFDRAVKMGLKGYVMNKFNGDVEIEVEGDRSLVEELIKAVKSGPRSSSVSDIKISWKNINQKFERFEIR